MDAWFSMRRTWRSKNDARLAAQTRQLRLLLEFRSQCSLPRGPLRDELKTLGIDSTRLYRNPVELGELCGFTVDEDLHLKRTTSAFFSAIYPAGFTKEQTRTRRHDYNKPHRAAQQRNRRAKEAARLAAANELDCRTSAVHTLLTHQWVSVADLMKGLRGSRAFRRVDGRGFLRGNSLRQAILRELKGPKLKDLVQINKQKEGHGLMMHRYRLR